MASVTTCSEFVADSEKVYAGLATSTAKTEKSWSVYRSRRPRTSASVDGGAVDAVVTFVQVFFACLFAAAVLGFILYRSLPSEKIPLAGGLLSAAALCHLYLTQRKSHRRPKDLLQRDIAAAMLPDADHKGNRAADAVDPVLLMAQLAEKKRQ